MTLKSTRVALVLLAVGVLVGAAPGEIRAAEADYNHVSITSSAPPESVRWYSEHLGCEAVADRDDTADCFGVEVTFVPRRPWAARREPASTTSASRTPT